ncbi:putative ribonuclease H-like domain-containing protein [Tanacetum coccineum]
MEFETAQNNTTAKLPILKLGEYEMWEMRIKQYFQVQDYALWEVIENDEKINKKNDVKARSLLLMSIPNEHQLTFSQYDDAKTMFAAIKTRFGGNEATKKTQKALLKQQYENFNASSTESLDSIFNRLQKLVSRLAILGVVITQEDLNSKFLRSLPPEWNTHVVKKSVGASNGNQNMAFMSAPSTSSTNDEVSTASPKVSTGSTNVNTASTQDSTASLSDVTIYAFLANHPNGSQLIHEDLEQIHKDNLEEMDLKWQLALLSMRARRYYQRTGKKITINGSDTAGYDKSKVECFNCHKLGHFAKEWRNPSSQDNRPRNYDQGSRNQENTMRTVNVEDTSSKAMLAIDGVRFDWSDMAEEQIQSNMALMAFSDSECDDLIVKLHETEFKAILKREIGCKDYEIGLLKTQFEKIKQEKEGLDEFKEPEFNKYGPRDTVLESTIDCDKESDNSKENTDDSLEKEQVTDNESSSVESLPNVVKKTIFHAAKKINYDSSGSRLDLCTFGFSNRRLEQTATYSILTISE